MAKFLLGTALTLIFAILISGCATNKRYMSPQQAVQHEKLMRQQLVRGREYFLEGHYKAAFKELYEPAVYCYPSAEYAVGYMYFYGKGIVLDIDMAQYWMRRAAEHGYPEAPAALAKIDRIVAMQRQPFSLPVPQLKLKALENNVNSYPNSQPGFEYETARP